MIEGGGRRYSATAELMKKVCVIGCGDHARHVYLESILRCQAEMPQILFSACCDTQQMRAQGFAQKIGAPDWYTDYREMLEQQRPDAVLLITPYHLTAEIASVAMHAGCAVLLEKPPAADYEECCALAEIARKTGCIHQVAFNRRHIPIVREMKKHIRSTPISHINYHMYRMNRTESDFYSTAVHGIDLICSLADCTCVTMHSLYGAMPGFGDGVKNILLQLAFANGMTAQLAFCPVSGILSEGMTVTTHSGSYRLEFPIWSDMDTGSLIFFDMNGNSIKLTASDGPHLFKSNGFYWQLQQFLQGVIENVQPPDSLDTVLETMRLMDFVREERPSC